MPSMNGMGTKICGLGAASAPLRAFVCQLVALSCTALCAACGSTVVIEDDAPAAAPQQSPPVVEEVFDCAPGDDARPMLAARLEHSLYFGYRDGSHREVFTFDVPEGGYINRAQVIARGDRIAAHAIIIPSAVDPTFAPFAELVVLDVAGDIEAYHRFDFAYEGWGSDVQLVGDQHGLFALTSLEVKTGIRVVVDGDEITTSGTSEDDKFAARSDPDALGRIVAQNYEGNSTTDLSFVDLRSGTVTPSEYVATYDVATHASGTAVVDRGIVYLMRNPARWVYEDADGLTVGALAAELEPVSHASDGWLHDGGWVLFMLGGNSPEAARYLALHAATRTTRTFTLQPPAPWSLPGDYWNAPPIDAEGRVVVPLYDGERLQVFATADGTSWTPLGLPITAGGYPTQLMIAGGAVMFDGYGSDFPVADGALPAYADQLIGPQGGEGTVLSRYDASGADTVDNPSGGDALSGDGRCFAYYRNASLHVVQTDTYAETDLGLAASADYESAETAWIPLAPPLVN